MIKKILLMMLVLSVQVHLKAIDYEDVEVSFQGLNTTIKIGDTNFFINESGVVTAQKEATNKRKFWLIMGGIAATSLVVGGAAASLYYYVKLGTLSKKIDTAKNVDIKKRLNSVKENVKKLQKEFSRYGFGGYSDEKNDCAYQLDLNKVELNLLVDFQWYNIKKKINDLKIEQNNLLGDQGYYLSGEKKLEYGLREIDLQELDLDIAELSLGLDVPLSEELPLYNLEQINKKRDELKYKRESVKHNMKNGCS